MRRIARRMALRRVGCRMSTPNHVANDPGEAKARPIHPHPRHVTSFFQDPVAFEALKRQVVPELRLLILDRVLARAQGSQT
jgi:chemotaxis methyl-accepting protein methylase